MTDKPDKFRTLDDPDEPPMTRARRLHEECLAEAEAAAKTGFAPGWRLAIGAHRPNAVRRFLMWALLGWKWERLE